MGYNTAHYNKDAEYAKKTIKQLQAELVEFEHAVETWTSAASPEYFTNHIAWLKMKIAERIGKK